TSSAANVSDRRVSRLRMTTETPDPLIQLAERVASIAAELGIATALIGATALAAHNDVRSTADIDLATAVDPFRELSALRKRLEAEGLHTELRLPDEEDSSGGVLEVRARADAEDAVEVLRTNPTADRALIRHICAKDGSAPMFDELVRQV
ncbi:MAG TPA: hypothetical protein VG963_12000, partial [Polyangiaceae bacterium]|nr:hypothetical protein [Polyangiaceae bacterium]